jgi:hypothetical protein
MSIGKITAKPGKIRVKTRFFRGYPCFYAGQSRKLRAETGLRFGAFRTMLT